MCRIHGCCMYRQYMCYIHRPYTCRLYALTIYICATCIRDIHAGDMCIMNLYVYRMGGCNIWMWYPWCYMYALYECTAPISRRALIVSLGTVITRPLRVSLPTAEFPPSPPVANITTRMARRLFPRILPLSLLLPQHKTCPNPRHSSSRSTPRSRST